MRKLFLSIVLTMALLLSAPAFAVEPGTIVDIAAGDDDFSILVDALTEAGLVETLQGEGPFTVFAPTNAAFAALLEDLDVTKEQLLAHRDLSKVLLYHVVSGEVMAGDLTDGLEADTVLGEKVTFSIDGENYSVNESAIGPADIVASNGVIHVIDKVLVPEAFGMKTIVETALADEDNFSILVAALQAADLVDALEADGPFTVFAPTNAAFAALLEALDITADDLLGHPDLAKVLLYHVVPAKVMSTDLSDGLEAETLNGQKIIFTINNDGAFADDSKISTADIDARNGVIHVIDTVLVPDDFVLAEEEMETQPGDNFTLYAAILLLLVSGLAIFASRKPKFAKQEE